MDCSTPLERIIERCQELEINCIAIADHGTVEGALKLKDIAPFTVIVAEEVLTPHGEIMGMFLKETIPSGHSVEWTIAQIRAQGGLVCIPHPFDRIRNSALDHETLERIVKDIDVLEAFNSRSPLLSSSAKTKAFAKEHSIAQSAGSDAHTPAEIGNAYVEMPEFTGRDDFIKALAQGKVFGQRTNPLRHFNSTLAKVVTFFSGKGAR